MTMTTFPLFALFGALWVARAADCGGCWCINGTDPCPDWEPFTGYDADDVAVWAAQEPLNPYLLDCNPYADPDCTTTPPQQLLDDEDSVCGLMYTDGSCAAYTLQTFASQADADAAGAVVTHLRSCGVCSTTQDLSVYVGNPDLTDASTTCGVIALLDAARGLACFVELGFTEPCAAIWNADAVYDASACGKVCARDAGAPYNGPPPQCELSDCLQCDEDSAGPLFAQVGGRTRRRSGLESEEARLCNATAQLMQVPCAYPARAATTAEALSAGTHPSSQ